MKTAYGSSKYSQKRIYHESKYWFDEMLYIYSDLLWSCKADVLPVKITLHKKYCNQL